MTSHELSLRLTIVTLHFSICNSIKLKQQLSNVFIVETCKYFFSITIFYFFTSLLVCIYIPYFRLFSSLYILSKVYHSLKQLITKTGIPIPTDLSKTSLLSWERIRENQEKNLSFNLSLMKFSISTLYPLN